MPSHWQHWQPCWQQDEFDQKLEKRKEYYSLLSKARVHIYDMIYITKSVFLVA